MGSEALHIRAILAANIRRIADEQDVSLNHLADFAGTSRSHLYAVLGEERAATVDWVAKIADALDVEVAVLVK